MRLLVVEDDSLLGNAVDVGLRQSGFAVDWFRDGAQADLALETTTYAVIVLDLSLPGITGLELLRRLRARGSHLPVLILTARDTVADRVRGLDAGADDYLIKPFEMAELTARIRALLRRAHARTQPHIAYRDLTIDLVTREVRRDGELVALSMREYAILVELLEHKGIALSREQLEESLYGWSQEIESNAVEVHIHHLRRKLGTDVIKTVRGVGYLVRKA